MSTTFPVHKIPAFAVPAGSSPVQDHNVHGAKSLRPWQEQGLTALRGQDLRILISPTGSGKSTLMKALSLDDLDRDPSSKIIIVVPQLLIAGSFEESALILDGAPRTWKAGLRLTDGKQTVDQLLAFLRDTPATPEGRIAVCSHQTLTATHKRLLGASSRRQKTSPWKGVSLYIDETHHSRAGDLPEDEDISPKKKRKAFRNALGEVVAHWIEHRPGPLLLATATWMRSNWTDIVPASRWNDFTHFTFSMEDFLAGMQHLREVSFRFLVGDVEKCIQALCEEGNAKSICYLPGVQTFHVKANGGKKEVMASYLKAIGKQMPGDDWTSTVTRRGKGPATKARVLDLVTEDGRDYRKSRFQSAIREQSGTPDLVMALNLGKEGFDWPELTRSIVVGERASIPDTLQMLGRLLRDHPGKPRVEFNMILPYDGAEDSRNGDLIRGYLKTMMASMVVEWQFQQRETVGRAAERQILEELRASHSEHVAKQIGQVIDEAILNADHKDADAIFDAAVTPPSGMEDQEAAKKALVKRLKRLFSERTKAMIQNASDLAMDLGVQESDVFGCIRLLAATFGHATLQSIREAVGSKPDLTEEMIREWAEEHKARTGKWPTCNGGKIEAAPWGERWGSVDDSLRRGERGLHGGTTLSILLRGYVSLTEDRIVEAAMEWHRQTGAWPTPHSGPCGMGRTWAAIDMSLRAGQRGLGGGSSLSQLLNARVGPREGGRCRGPITASKVVSAAKSWAQEHGERPTRVSGQSAELGCTWRAIDSALHKGNRGLPGGSSLAQLLDKHGIR